jgi:serine/threonine protein kinase
MGEVYSGRDTRLGRDVALKILPAVFASDPDRVARFEREARVLASLDHPSIAAIHGLEESNSVRALVLALVDGPTLADRIAAGPIALEEPDRSSNRRSCRVRTRGRRHPPRLKARQHQNHVGRNGEGAGFWLSESTRTTRR